MDDEAVVSAEEIMAERDRPGRPIPELVDLYRRHYGWQLSDSELEVARDAMDASVVDALRLLAGLDRPGIADAVKRVAAFVDVDPSIVRAALSHGLYMGLLVLTGDRHLEVPG